MKRALIAIAIALSLSGCGPALRTLATDESGRRWVITCPDLVPVESSRCLAEVAPKTETK